MCCDIYCYKISSFSEQTANSLENFWWEQKPGKTQLPRFCFDYCIRGSLLFYPARKLLMCLALWCSHHDSSYCCSCLSHLARVNSNTPLPNAGAGTFPGCFPCQGNVSVGHRVCSSILPIPALHQRCPVQGPGWAGLDWSLHWLQPRRSVLWPDGHSRG